MGLKVGGEYKLRVLPNVGAYEDIDTGAGFVDEMWAFRGHVLVATIVPKASNPRLRLPSGEEYYFSPNWLEPANKFKGNK